MPATCRRCSRIGDWHRSDRPQAVVLVRVLFFLAMAAIAVAFLLYLYKRDRRYLRFIVQVIKFTIILLVAVIVYFAVQRWFGTSA